MIAVMNIPKMEVAPASAAAAAEGFPEHMGALSVGIDHGYGKVEDVREQHAKELQRDKKNDEAKAEAAAAKAPLEAAPEALAKEQYLEFVSRLLDFIRLGTKDLAVRALRALPPRRTRPLRRGGSRPPRAGR